jgi:hypothetical protein
MDPITLIVTALATGAVAGLKPTAEKVVKDAYEGLKKIIKDKYERSQKAMPVLEDDPAAEDSKALVRKRLEEEGAAGDEDLLRQAQAVLQAVQERDADAARAAGVQIEDLKAGANVRIEDIVSTTGPVGVRRVQADQDITIGGIRVGETEPPPGKDEAPGA